MAEASPSPRPLVEVSQNWKKQKKKKTNFDFPHVFKKNQFSFKDLVEDPRRESPDDGVGGGGRQVSADGLHAGAGGARAETA